MIYILPWMYLMIGHVWWKQWLAAYFCLIFSRWYPIPMLSPSGHSRLNWLLSSFRFYNPQGVQSVSQSLMVHVFSNWYEIFGYLHWTREIVYGRGALYWSYCLIGKTKQLVSWFYAIISKRHWFYRLNAVESEPCGIAIVNLHEKIKF